MSFSFLSVGRIFASDRSDTDIVKIVENNPGMRRKEVMEAAAKSTGFTVGKVESSYRNGPARRDVQKKKGLAVVSVKGEWFATNALLGVDSDDPGAIKALLRGARATVSNADNAECLIDIVHSTSTPAIAKAMEDINEAVELAKAYMNDVEALVAAEAEKATLTTV